MIEDKKVIDENLKISTIINILILDNKNVKELCFRIIFFVCAK